MSCVTAAEQCSPCSSPHTLAGRRTAVPCLARMPGTEHLRHAYCFSAAQVHGDQINSRAEQLKLVHLCVQVDGDAPENRDVKQELDVSGGCLAAFIPCTLINCL